ncbi:hypothetical protein [Sphaerisporangium sp. NPDC051011]|uniref:hypothetical protein n=1 Tax=Sphaerisporangium sp. NPDC051011 TaxID=3155792 RepID=UPI0033E96B29
MHERIDEIALEQQWYQTTFLPVRHVVVGQQRLTTLQLLLNAAQLVTERHGSRWNREHCRCCRDTSAGERIRDDI